MRCVFQSPTVLTHATQLVFGLEIGDSRWRKSCLEGTWVISNMSLNLNGNEPEAMGSAHSLAQQGRTAGVCAQAAGWTMGKGAAEAAMNKMTSSCTCGR